MQLYNFNKGRLRAIIDIGKVGKIYNINLGIGTRQLYKYI